MWASQQRYAEAPRDWEARDKARLASWDSRPFPSSSEQHAPSHANCSRLVGENGSQTSESHSTLKSFDHRTLSATRCAGEKKRAATLNCVILSRLRFHMLPRVRFYPLSTSPSHTTAWNDILSVTNPNGRRSGPRCTHFVVWTRDKSLKGQRGFYCLKISKDLFFSQSITPRLATLLVSSRASLWPALPAWYWPVLARIV